MSKFTLSAAILLMSVVPLTAFGQDDEIIDTRPIAAVYEIQLEGFSLPDARITKLTDRFRDWVIAAGQYRVVAGEDTAAALVEVKAASHDPRCDTSCKVQLGKALAASKLIETRVEKIAGKCVVSATVYDVGQEILEVAGETDNPVACSDAGIRSGLREVAAKLIDPAAASASVRKDPVAQPRTVVTDTGRIVDLSRIDTGENIVNIETGDTGLVLIKSIPERAALMINNQPRGNAPKSLELPVGKYVIIATLDDFYHVARTEVTVEANTKKIVTMELAPAFGRLDVACSPVDAEVRIDGVFAGTCPFTNPRIRSGEHTIEVRKALYESVSQRATVVDGRTTSTRFDLPASWGRLDVSSTPAGAQVWFDGNEIGVTPMATDMIAAGRYKVRIEMPLYEPVSFDVELGGGHTVRKEVALLPDSGLITVATTPPGAMVVVDDGLERCDATPCTFPELPTGVHVLTVEMDGYAREVRTIDLGRGGRENVSMELRGKMGGLTVFSRYPDGTDCEGEIFIDGRRQDEMTPFIGQLLATSHVVTVRCPDGAVATETVDVEYNHRITRTLTVCRPDCDGKSCGPDGCGGVCGTCYGTADCIGGECVSPAPAGQREVFRPAPVGGGPATIPGGPGSSMAGNPPTAKQVSSGFKFTWETLGIGSVISLEEQWVGFSITPIELGFKVLNDVLFAVFATYQMLFPWKDGGFSDFANVLQIGARAGYQFLDTSDGKLGLFVDGKLGWEYEFDRSGVFPVDNKYANVSPNQFIIGARLGIRYTILKFSLGIDYSTGNGAGFGMTLSLGN